MKTVGQALALLLWCVLADAQQFNGTTSASRPLSPDAVMSAWEAALGGHQSLQQVKTVHWIGTVVTGGLRGSFERWATAYGELRTVIDLNGAFRQTVVFDGQRAWIQDKAGAVHDLRGELLQEVINSAFEASDSMFFSGRLPGDVSLAGRDSAGSLIVHMSPRNGSSISVYLDSKSFLPLREETTGPMGTRIVSFSDWQEYSGVKFPGAIRQSSGNASFDSVITMDRIEINSDPPHETFSRPASIPEKVHFSRNEHSVSISARVFGDHLLIPVRVNGSDPEWFFLDSGAATSVISESLAAKAGVPSNGNIRGQGTGAGSTSLALAQNVTFDLSGLSIPPSTVAVWDLSILRPALGTPWDGLVGLDVLSRVIARVDYQSSVVTFIDPSIFIPEPNVVALPVKFVGNLPVVHGKILLPGREPIETNVAIDSGANGLHLTTPFTMQNRVFNAIHKRISSSAQGAGGTSSTSKGRLSGLQLGPYLLRAPIAAFSSAEQQGLLASADIGALVGGEILQRFTVTFDFPHDRILLEPNSRFSNPFLTNESGLALIAEGQDFRHFVVDDVEPGSPAARAGLQKGDILTSVNGRPAAELDLSLVNGLLQAGHTPIIKVQRNQTTVEVRVSVPERM